MKPQLKQFAPLGLYLSLLALLVSIGLYIVQKNFNLPLQISLSVIILGFAIYILLDPQGARKALTGRQARYGSNALIMSLAFVGILIVINYLVYNNDHRWDLTEDKQHTLASETIQILQSLKEPVSVEAFFSTDYSSDDARKLLDSYKYNSKGKLDYKFIDPVANPLEANQAKVTRDGTIVLSSNGLTEQVTYASEQDLSSALIRLINPGERVIYFLTGHGEIDPQSSGDISYNMAATTLRNKNYTVNTLNLLSTPSIPDNALAIIVAGPQKPLSQAEVNMIEDYLDNHKGNLVYLSETPPLTQFGSEKDPLADYLKQSWGIVLGQDFVIDPNVNPPSVSVAASYGTHPITEKLMGYAAFFPFARSVSLSSEKPSTVNQTVLASTASNAWGETDFESIKSNVSLDKTKDFVGPVPLAVAAYDTFTNARVIVVGATEFAGDSYFTELASGDFFINSIDWVTQQENLINLTPKTQTTRFMVPPLQTTMGLILLGTVFIIPGAVIVMGIATWIQRRRRG